MRTILRLNTVVNILNCPWYGQSMVQMVYMWYR